LNRSVGYPISDHFDGKRFFNPQSPQAKGFLDVLRWKLTTRPADWSAAASDMPAAVPPQSVSGSECRVTLVNHSTVLIQCSGCSILTDPIWSDRASPVSWFGPQRFAKPGVRITDLPPIDLILLSHNHYDHLDLRTLHQLIANHKPRMIAPLGVPPFLARHGIKGATELDWWQSDGHITCLPALHFSARGVTDRNRTLWCSYWIATPAGGIYFAADSALGPHFEEIYARLGAPRLALLPIGAYKPEWFMQPIHMSPSQAVEAHRLLHAEHSLAIHWGTFQLADDSRTEPADELGRALAQDPGLAPFEALPNGGVVQLR
jgi:L-ascorbate metabolism protein UlaG (beta-lactamase superfamily)